MQNKALTLFELNKTVQLVINDSFPKSYWVIAEISEIKVNYKGHCYLELIEKDQGTENLIAKARAIIWSNTFKMLKPYFESTTGHELSTGLKILVYVSVEFHELYGYSLNIKDIDPCYTLGDLAKKRLETLKRLENEGVINMNKELSLPSVPQKIAIISSETAAGFGDFIDQIENNIFHYKFYVKLFPALMQGKEAEESIIGALNKICKYEDFFDAVVIIRGGGSQSDLSCFNNYWLAYHITQFPLPVITGIGHEQDESIVDIVAHTKMKTPTAVAEFLISKISEFDSYLVNLQNNFAENVNSLILEKKSTLNFVSHKFSPLVKSKLTKKESELNILFHQFEISAKNYFASKHQLLNNQFSNIIYSAENCINQKKQEFTSIYKIINLVKNSFFNRKKNQIEIFEKTLKYLKPENILKRGYSLTLVNGIIVKFADQLKKNDIIESRLSKGIVESKVRKVFK